MNEAHLNFYFLWYDYETNITTGTTNREEPLSVKVEEYVFTSNFWPAKDQLLSSYSFQIDDVQITNINILVFILSIFAYLVETVFRQSALSDVLYLSALVFTLFTHAYRGTWGGVYII